MKRKRRKLPDAVIAEQQILALAGLEYACYKLAELDGGF